MQERVTVILGTTGTGKTTRLQQLMDSGPPRQFLLDTTGDPKFQNWGVSVDSFEEMVDYAYRTPAFRIRWSIPPRTPLTIDGVAWLAMQRGAELGDTLVAVDEIQYYIRKVANGIPQSFQDACLTGRHTNVYLIATSQRSALVHNDFLSQSQRWYVFQTLLRDDLECVKHLIPNVHDRAKDLPIGKYLTYPETGD